MSNFTNNYFYHVSAAGGTLHRSSDGRDLTWESIATDCPTSGSVNTIASIACHDKACVVVGSDSSLDRALCTATTGPTGPYTDNTPVTGTPIYDIVRFVPTTPYLRL